MSMRLMPIDAAPVVALSVVGSSGSVALVGGVNIERLKHYLIFQFVRGARKVQFICGDNRIDVLLLARMARSNGIDDEDLLGSIILSRAFTAYQMAELVLRLDESLIGQLVVVSDPCGLFQDDEIRSVEAARYFYRMLWHMADLQRRGMKFLITHRPGRRSRRAYFGRDLLRATETVLHMGSGTSLVVQRREFASLQRGRGLPAAQLDQAQGGGE